MYVTIQSSTILTILTIKIFKNITFFFKTVLFYFDRNLCKTNTYFQKSYKILRNFEIMSVVCYKNLYTITQYIN